MTPIAMFTAAIRKVLRDVSQLRDKEKRRRQRSKSRPESIQGVQQPNFSLDFLNGFREKAGKHRKRSAHQKRRNDEDEKTREKSENPLPPGTFSREGANAQ